MADRMAGSGFVDMAGDPMDDGTRKKFLFAIGGVFVLAIAIFLANALSRGLL